MSSHDLRDPLKSSEGSLPMAPGRKVVDNELDKELGSRDAKIVHHRTVESYYSSNDNY